MAVDGHTAMVHPTLLRASRLRDFFVHLGRVSVDFPLC